MSPAMRLNGFRLGLLLAAAFGFSPLRDTAQVESTKHGAWSRNSTRPRQWRYPPGRISPAAFQLEFKKADFQKYNRRFATIFPRDFVFSPEILENLHRFKKSNQDDEM